MTAHTIPPIATPVSSLDDAHAVYIIAVAKLKPRPLRVLNTRGMLVDRADLIKAHIEAFATYLHELIEDTAQNVNCDRREADDARAVLHDLAGDLRGRLTEAMRDVVVAA